MRETDRLRVALTARVLCLSVLVVDLHRLNLRELLEIQPNQIGDIKVLAFRSTHAGQVDVGNAIRDFQAAIACKSVIDTDPAIDEAFSGTWTLEKFVERPFRQPIAAHPAFA